MYAFDIVKHLAKVDGRLKPLYFALEISALHLKLRNQSYRGVHEVLLLLDRPAVVVVSTILRNMPGSVRNLHIPSLTGNSFSSHIPGSVVIDAWPSDAL